MEDSGKLPTFPSPNLILTLTSSLGQNVGLGRGGWADFRSLFHTTLPCNVRGKGSSFQYNYVTNAGTTSFYIGKALVTR